MTLFRALYPAARGPNLRAPLFAASRTIGAANRLSRRPGNAAPRRSRRSRGLVDGLLGALFAGLAAGPAAGQATLGVKAGASLSDLIFTGIEINDREARRGVVGGVSLTLPVSELLGLQMEGSFVQRGATLTFFQLGDVEYTIDYVQLSVLGKASLPLGGPRSSLYLLAGPVVAWETTCDATVTFVLQQISETSTCDDERLGTPSKPVDLAVAAGAGVQVAVTGRVGLSLDLVYTYGVRSIYAGELDRTSHNRAMSVQAGVFFPLG